MNVYSKVRKTGLVILLLLFGFAGTLFAQTDHSAEEESQKYNELVEYQSTYTIEQEDQAASLSETLTGINTQNLNDVYLAESAFADASGELKKAEGKDPVAEEETPVGDFEFVEYEDLFAGEGSGNSSGFGAGASTGHCPPGGGGGIRF